MDGGAIEEFEGAGDDLRGDDGGDGFGGAIHLGEGGNHGFLRLGFGNEAKEHFGDDAEGAFGADEQVLEGIAGDVFHAFVAEPHDFALGQDNFHAHDIIAGDAVFESAEAAGIFGDIAANGGDFHGAGVG